jgi:hypothetical protein
MELNRDAYGLVGVSVIEGSVLINSANRTPLRRGFSFLKPCFFVKRKCSGDIFNSPPGFWRFRLI